MKAHLLGGFTFIHRNVREEDVDNIKDGRTNSDFKFGVGEFSKNNPCR
jgi:hypothetical protein